MIAKCPLRAPTVEAESARAKAEGGGSSPSRSSKPIVLRSRASMCRARQVNSRSLPIEGASHRLTDVLGDRGRPCRRAPRVTSPTLDGRAIGSTDAICDGDLPRLLRRERSVITCRARRCSTSTVSAAPGPVPHGARHDILQALATAAGSRCAARSADSYQASRTPTAAAGYQADSIFRRVDDVITSRKPL